MIQQLLHRHFYCTTSELPIAEGPEFTVAHPTWSFSNFHFLTAEIQPLGVFSEAAPETEKGSKRSMAI